MPDGYITLGLAGCRIVTRPFTKLSRRVGSGHETRSMQTAVERGWEGSCKAKNKYAPIFLGNPLLASITR